MTVEHRRRIDILLDPDYLTDLETVPLAELRDRRRMADEVETELSFYRRLLHGRIDLLAFEAQQGAGGDQGEERRSQQRQRHKQQPERDHVARCSRENSDPRSAAQRSR